MVNGLITRQLPVAESGHGLEAGSDWMEERALAVPIPEALGIACGTDGLVAVCGDSEIVLYRHENLLWRVQTEDQPRCLALGRDAVYVGMVGHVLVLSHSGEQEATWQTLGELARITSIAAVDGRVVVADAGQRGIFIYDLTGRLIDVQRGPNRRGAEFRVPGEHFDIAARGTTLWIADPGRKKVIEQTADASGEVEWGGDALFAGCCNPAHLAAFGDGSLVTAEKGKWLVRVHDEGGRVSSRVTAGRPVADLATDDEGRIFLLEAGSNVLRVFARKEQG